MILSEVRKDQEAYCYIFNEDTTPEDLKRVFEEYKIIAGIKSKSRQKPISNFKIYKRILELTEAKHSDKEIAAIIRVEFKRRIFITEDASRGRYKAKKHMLPYKECL